MAKSAVNAPGPREKLNLQQMEPALCSVKGTELISKCCCYTGDYQKKVTMNFEKTWNTLVLGISFSLGLSMVENAKMNWKQSSWQSWNDSPPTISLQRIHRQSRVKGDYRGECVWECQHCGVVG